MIYEGGKENPIGQADPGSIVFLRVRPQVGGRPDTQGRMPGLRVKARAQAGGACVRENWPDSFGTIPSEPLPAKTFVDFEDDGHGLYLPCGGEISIVGGDGLFDVDVIHRQNEPGKTPVLGWSRTYELAAGAITAIPTVELGWGYESVECNVPFYVDFAPLRVLKPAGLDGQRVYLPSGLKTVGLAKQSADVDALFTIRGRL